MSSSIPQLQLVYVFIIYSAVTASNIFSSSTQQLQLVIFSFDVRMLRQALLHVIVFAAIKAQHCLDEQVCLRNASQFILLPKHSVEESCGLIFIVSVDLTDLREIIPIECLKLLPCCILADLLIC